MIPYDISIRYMVAGYAVIILVLITYVLSLLSRWMVLKRNLRSIKDGIVRARS